MFQERDRLVGHGRVVKRLAGVSRATVAPTVKGSHAVRRRERPTDGVEHQITVREPAVQEHDRFVPVGAGRCPGLVPENADI